MARSLAAPFGIEVVDETGVGVVPGFKTNPGDTVFETLEQLARAKGVLLTTDGRGRLVICRASKKKAATVLELGKNVFEGKGKFSMRDRFSSVTVIGQTAATETWNGKSASQQKTVVTDAAVPRHRPLVLVADQEHQGANKRAQWEVNVRYGKGNQATYTVYGWKDGDALWTPNVLVRIVDPFMGLEATWLVGSVGWTLDERGYRSELTLNPPEAFDVEPVSPKKGKKDKETFRWPEPIQRSHDELRKASRPASPTHGDAHRALHPFRSPLRGRFSDARRRDHGRRKHGRRRTRRALRVHQQSAPGGRGRRAEHRRAARLMRRAQPRQPPGTACAA